MNIDLGKKIVGSNLHKLFKLHWSKSLEAKNITFQFDKLEWISNTAISCILSWIKVLEDNNISVYITLQSSVGVMSNSPEYINRTRCLEKLMNQWSLRDRVSTANILIDGGIKINNYPKSDFSDFAPIPIIKYETTSFDIEFDQMYNSRFSEFTNKLQKSLEQTAINYYDSNFLNYSILKELYSNVCLHSNSISSLDCFFSVGVNKKYSGDSKFVSKSRVEELSYLELDYFTDNKAYRNIDFIEFNFHDFGVGIVESLKEKYLNEDENDLKKFFGSYYKKHLLQKLDTRIIEYSLLLFTSRYEIERQFEVHDYIPRGLFILKDIVKKYQGYIEIRSNRGALSLSFKHGKTIITYADDKDVLFFPGTQIKIVFPSLEKNNTLKEVVLETGTRNIVTSDFANIHFLNEYAKVESNLKSRFIKNDAEFFKNRLTGSLFTEFLNHFKNIKKDSIILVDFAGIEPKTVDFFNKFIYFINHVPLAGDTRLIIYNNVTKGLNSTILFNSSNDLKSKGFLPYPIPCIHVDTEVEWLGVEDEFSKIFTQLWIGDTRNELVFENIINYNTKQIQINSIGEDRFKIVVNLPPFSEILEKLDEQIQNTIISELENKGIQFYNLTDRDKLNYNNVVLSERNKTFLTSSGAYLNEYISFNEKLYILAYRRMVASYFVFKIHLHCEGVSKLNKILSVTLSSQLIGNETKDILNNLLNKNIDLIALSNYYNFQNEEKFNDIKAKDKVIFVSDVISSGSLAQDIIKSVEIKGATVLSCLSIVDLRGIIKDVDGIPVLPLAEYKIEHLSVAPEGYEIEVINPVLNVPTSIPKSNSMGNVLMEKEEFLNHIDEKYLLLGNLRNNSVYFNYYLKTDELLKDDKENKYRFLKELLSKLTSLKKRKNHAELNYLLKGLDQVSKNVSSPDVIKDFEKINKQLYQLHKKLTPDLFNDYNIDIVFYPFLSNISVVEDNINLFKNEIEDNRIPLIFPIPRIMTTRGWRFSFPPKFLDVLINNQNEMSALIIDDGSMTGDTIMQMIDSISFLSVKSIDVFSIFGRLEDYQKEFYSRIKSVQVKGSVAPINIYFGTHFNIPVHNNIENPASIEHREIDELESSLKKHNIEMSDLFESFINSRRNKLENSNYPNADCEQTPLFDSVSKKQVFIIRDFLGRFGSYRLYSDDIPLNNFDFLIIDKQAILTLLTVLNIEPRLYQTIKRVFPKEKIMELIDNIRKEFLSDLELMDSVWKRDFFIKALYHLSPTNFFNTENLIHLSEKLFQFDDSDSKVSFKYFEYLLILVKLNIKNIDNAFTAKSFETNVEDFSHQLKKRNSKIFEELRFVFTVYHQVQRNNSFDYSFPINKYYKLREYYNGASIYESRHDDKLLTNLFIETNKKLSVLKYSIENKISEDIDKNVEALKSELLTLKSNYSNRDYFKFIKDIVMDLKRFSNTDLPINIESIVTIINKFENYLDAEFDYQNITNLNECMDSIDKYRNNLLIIKSPFASFIMESKTSLLNEWEKAENVFLLNNTDAIKIERNEVEEIEVDVNPYALNIAFDNLLSNKHNYAKNVSWSLKTQKYDEYSELIITQNSKFLYDKGDGTGQNSIKSILKNYGVFYKKISDNPYTLKLTFSKT